MGRAEQFVGSMVKTVPLPKGLKPKSPYAVLDNFMNDFHVIDYYATG